MLELVKGNALAKLKGVSASRYWYISIKNNTYTIYTVMIKEAWGFSSISSTTGIYNIEE